jgi:hypothetical protein
VTINDEIGDPKPLSYGVPQGSVLGPVFYLLYTREIEKIIERYHLNVNLYADDCQIYFKIKPDASDLHSIEERIMGCVNAIKKWMRENFLKLNPTKTMVKLFKPEKEKEKEILNSFKLNLDNSIIQPSSIVKVLGVTLGSKLNLEEFITRKVQICNYQLKNFNNIKHSLPQDTKMLLVNNMIISVLDYCNSLLICTPDCYIRPLEKVLNKAVRFICGLRLRTRNHITPYLFKLHILPIKFRIRFKISLTAFKIVRNLAPLYLKENFQMFKRGSACNLRHGIGRDELMFDINLDQQKKTTIYTSLIIEWNSLPLEIRKITQLERFKVQLKTYYFREAFADLL